MAKENKILDLAFAADESLVDDKYTFVVLDVTSGQIRRPNSAAEHSLGILQNAPGIGEAAVVRIEGISKLIVNAQLAIGTFVAPEYVGAADAGKGSDASADPNYARAVLLEASGAEDDVVTCWLIPSKPVASGDVALADGYILVGNASNIATAVTLSGAVTITRAGVASIAANVITPIKMGVRTAVACADAAKAATIAELMTSSIFTMTPTAARNFTTPIASAIVAGITGATVQTWFDFTIVNLGNFPITIVAGDGGVTISGNAVVNKGSATFRVVLTNVTAQAESLIIYRMDGAVVAANIPLADGTLLIGDPNGLAAAHAISGDITISDAGVAAIQSGKVTAAMLASGVLFSAGLGASANYSKAATGVNILAAGTAGAKVVLIIVTVTEVFANGNGGQPTFIIGEHDGAADKFMAVGVLTNAALGAVKLFVGSLTASKNLEVTAVAGSGTTETGAISVAAMILPATA